MGRLVRIIPIEEAFFNPLEVVLAFPFHNLDIIEK
jgi:hypothetical protein